MGVGYDSFIKCKQYLPETLILAKASNKAEISFSSSKVCIAGDRSIKTITKAGLRREINIFYQLTYVTMSNLFNRWKLKIKIWNPKRVFAREQAIPPLYISLQKLAIQPVLPTSKQLTSTKYNSLKKCLRLLAVPNCGQFSVVVQFSGQSE